jgi:hypothetical protein
MIPMVDYSDSVPPVAPTSTVYGVDSAIVIVVSAALFFWAAVGIALWLYF